MNFLGGSKNSSGYGEILFSDEIVLIKIIENVL